MGLEKSEKSRGEMRNEYLTAIGTVISGTIFLSSALTLVGLPGGAAFSFFFITAVLPAVALNTGLMIILYPIVTAIAKRSNIIQTA